MKFLIAYLIAFCVVGAPTSLNARPQPENGVTTKSENPKTFRIGDPGVKIGDPGLVIGDSVRVGDKAKGLLVLPPWTMRKCPTVFYGTYDKTGAKELRKLDSACDLWKKKVPQLEAQTTDLKSVVTGLKATVATHEQERKQDQQRIQDLLKQVKDEIAEKNKYKYKPNYNWLYISVGAALAAVGIAFGVGVWVAKD